jgi:hypothetical protein
VLVALLLIARSAPPEAPPAYGIATAGGNEGASEVVAECRRTRVPCPAGELELAPPFAGDSRAAQAFAAFREHVLDPGGYMRLWAPFDVLSAWNAAHGRCGPSPYALGRPAPFNALNGTEVFDRLVWNIQGARALGLIPEVVFSAGSGEGVPAYPDPGYGDASHPFVGLTPAGLDYYCGVAGVMVGLRAALGSEAPNRWEAFNEPDKYPAYQTNVQGLCGHTYAACGPLEAAELWELANSVASRIGDQKVAALSLTYPDSPYAAAYLQLVSSSVPCPIGREPVPISCQFPRYWAVHDYDDPTAGGTADLSSFEKTLSAALRARDGGPVYVWVTEAGVNPGSQTRFDDNRRGCRGSEPDNAGTLGACVDNVPRAQERGARAWRRLLDVSAPGVRTTQVYWFEFELINGWDSALVDAEGRPRASLCALVGGLECDGNPRDYLLDGPSTARR